MSKEINYSQLLEKSLKTVGLKLEFNEYGTCYAHLQLEASKRIDYDVFRKLQSAHAGNKDIDVDREQRGMFEAVTLKMKRGSKYYEQMVVLEGGIQVYLYDKFRETYEKDHKLKYEDTREYRKILRDKEIKNYRPKTAPKTFDNLSTIRAELFSAPDEVKKSFNRIVKFFSNDYEEIRAVLKTAKRYIKNPKLLTNAGVLIQSINFTDKEVQRIKKELMNNLPYGYANSGFEDTESGFLFIGSDGLVLMSVSNKGIELRNDAYIAFRKR